MFKNCVSLILKRKQNKKKKKIEKKKSQLCIGSVLQKLIKIIAQI